MEMTLIYILAIVVLLGLCVTIHELGHLLGGMMVGIKAKTFSIGFGKGLIKKKIGDTTYQIAPIPLGGYCQFYGEDPSEEREGKGYEFLTAHPLKRILVVIMGPLFNLIFGIILFFVMNLVGYQVETNRIFIPSVLKSGENISPAVKGGLKEGDRIVAINGSKIYGFRDLQSRIAFGNGKEIALTVERDNDIIQTQVTPTKKANADYFTIGVAPYGTEIMVVDVSDNEPAQKSGLRKYDVISSIDGNTDVVKEAALFTSYLQSHAGKELTLNIKRRNEPMTVKMVPRWKESIKLVDLERPLDSGKYEFSFDDIELLNKTLALGKLSVNKNVVKDMAQLKRVLSENKDKVITMETAGAVYKGKVEYKQFGFGGILTSELPAPQMDQLKFGPGEGFVKAMIDPWNFIVMNVKGLGMLFTGKLNPRENLSGPIRIAQIAGDTAYYRGISAFIILMAQISIILMIMNLLPIPAVDGSFIIFFTLEAIKGKPLNQKVMEKIQMTGVILLIMLGVFVIFNDLSQLEFFNKLFNLR